jgi:membrane fusion protein, multidrug efflux system
MPQHVPRLILVPILFFALILGMVACSPKQEAAEPIRSVKLITVGSSELNVQGEYAAEVRARTESRLAFRVGGKILARQAEAGQRVQAGQVLAEVDVQDYALAAQAAQALAIGARAQRDLAASDYKRYEALLAQNFISAAELERRSAVLKAAQSSLDQALSQAQFQAKSSGLCQIAGHHFWCGDGRRG